MFNITPVAPGQSCVRKVVHLQVVRLSGAYSIIQMVYIYKLILNLLFTSHGTIAHIHGQTYISYHKYGLLSVSKDVIKGGVKWGPCTSRAKRYTGSL